MYRGGAVIFYITTLGLYTRLSHDPIVFFASLFMAAVISALAGVLLWALGKKRALFDGFAVTLMSMVYFLGLVLFITFGPVFIDRSISYHLAFYATENEKIFVDDIRDEFSKEIFEKRIHDAIATGFLKANEDGSCSPSGKAKIMTVLLLPLGKLTGTLKTYETMKKEIKE